MSSVNTDTEEHGNVYELDIFLIIKWILTANLAIAFILNWIFKVQLPNEIGYIIPILFGLVPFFLIFYFYNDIFWNEEENASLIMRFGFSAMIACSLICTSSIVYDKLTSSVDKPQKPWEQYQQAKGKSQTDKFLNAEIPASDLKQSKTLEQQLEEKYPTQTNSQRIGEITEFLKDAPNNKPNPSVSRKYSDYPSSHNYYSDDSDSNKDEESYASKSYQYSIPPTNTSTNYSSASRDDYRNDYSNSYSTNNSYSSNSSKKYYDEPSTYNDPTPIVIAPPPAPSQISDCNGSGCYGTDNTHYDRNNDGTYYSSSGKFCENIGGQMECH